MNYRTKERKLNLQYGWNEQRLGCLNYLFNNVFKFKRDNKEYSFTATNIDYDNDEYYKDGYDPHRYIEFSIKELPMWRFGIWFLDPEQYDNKKAGYKYFFKGTLFAQVEQFCDKFKPSRSSFVTEFIYNPKHTVEFSDGTSELVEEDISSNYEIQKTLVFMLEQPALAFCRDVCFWDYNIEYHTKAEAERTMNKIIRDQDISDANKKIMADKVVDFCRNLVTNRKLYFKDYITDAFLSIPEDNRYPKRDLYLYWNDTEQEPGWYGFDPKSDMTKEGYTYWKDCMKEMKKLSRKLNVLFWEFETVDLYCLSLTNDKKRYNKLKKNYNEKSLEK